MSFLTSRTLLVAAALLLPALWSTRHAFAAEDAPGRTREVINDGDVRIDVIVEGQGPTVVLLPSSQRDSEDFDDLASRLAASGLRVLRPQPRGMGASRGPMNDLTLHVLARDVAQAILQLGGGRAVLVGHAYGHFVARVVDLDHSALVRGIVVAGAAAKVFPPQRWRPRPTANELKDLLGDRATVQVVPYASHALIPEQPAAVADAIVS